MVMGVCVGFMYRYKRRRVDLFVRSWVRVRLVALGSAVSGVCTIVGICL